MLILRRMCILIAVALFAACPASGSSGSSGTDADVAERRPDAGRDASGLDDAGESLGLATQLNPLPPPPDERTLCMLGFTRQDHAGTDLTTVQTILGKATEESMSKSDAGLEYVYANGATIYLSFTWNEHLCAKSIVKGCRDVNPAYYLAEANTTGIPYPSCWPH